MSRTMTASELADRIKRGEKWKIAEPELKMEDRQLLELAAKAIGKELTEFWNWNPLTDDGDALRLAVKLGMEVWVDTHPDGCECTEAQSITYSTSDNACRSIVNHNNDPCAATRRAIVIAAAEIGGLL